MAGEPPSGPVVPDWEYLIAHHFPNRYGRTLSLKIGRRVYHFCARCTGQALGFLALLSLFAIRPPFEASAATPAVALVLAVCPAAALADWLTQAVRSRESNNFLRLASGALLGVAVCGLLAYGLTQNWLLFASGLAVLGLYLGLALLVLSRTGSMRRVVADHFP